MGLERASERELALTVLRDLELVSRVFSPVSELEEREAVAHAFAEVYPSRRDDSSVVLVAAGMMSEIMRTSSETYLWFAQYPGLPRLRSALRDVFIKLPDLAGIPWLVENLKRTPRPAGVDLPWARKNDDGGLGFMAEDIERAERNREFGYAVWLAVNYLDLIFVASQTENGLVAERQWLAEWMGSAKTLILEDAEAAGVQLSGSWS